MHVFGARDTVDELGASDVTVRVIVLGAVDVTVNDVVVGIEGATVNDVVEWA
jgi:hypothetical protein